MKMNKLRLLTFLLLASIACFNSCSGKKVDENNPQELFNDAEDDVKDKRYEMALDKFKTVKNKFPYSHYATRAQLRIADVYYLEESYIEAAGAYETFRDLHPKNEKADYVIFRIGESYYNQLPGTIDRDLTPASKGLDAYRELLTLYPQSPYSGDAKTHQADATERLAAKEKYIADFYFQQAVYDSAAQRFEKITTKYAGTKDEQYAYARWGLSLIKYGEALDKEIAKEKDDKAREEKEEARKGAISEARHAYRTYLSRFPEGTYVGDANSKLEELGAR